MIVKSGGMGLRKLTVNSFAIIDHLTVQFNEGFSVITGETGAGKSIIIDALNLTLGEKAMPSMIRAGADRADIECVFTGIPSDHPVNQFIRSNNIPVNADELILKRELNGNGRSKAWINGNSCPINVLKSAGDLLVDLHGQHDHQSLLREDNHIDFLDIYGEYDSLLDDVRESYRVLRQLIERHKLLIEKRTINREKRELWEFQLKEINKVDPVENEYEELVKEKKLLDNAEKIHLLSEELTNSLYESDENTLYREVLEVIRKLGTLNSIDPEFTDELKRFEEIKYTIQELSRHLSEFNRRIQFDPNRAESVNQRLFALQQLIKKYGSDVAGVIQYRTQLEENLNEDDGLDRQIEDMEKEIIRAKEHYIKAAVLLSRARKETAHRFEREIVSLLSTLGIDGSRFEVSIEGVESEQGWVTINEKQIHCDESGIDRIVFKIATNPGEPLRPLAEIVSGGEVSRLMLAMKSILAGKDHIPVVIFDEIDTGISGKVAQIVGRHLKNLSTLHQVICITHLPQIAGLGNHHYRVYKETSDGRSRTKIDLLTNDERVDEIAGLIGGSTIPDITRKQAQDLLKN